MARQPQSIEKWLKGHKERQDWIDQELRNEGLRRFTEVGQSRVDTLISDLNQALPEGADRAEAIRRLKLRWRVFKCTQKNETSTLSVSVNKRTLKSLKKLANSRGETQKATLEKLIEEGFQTEADKKAAIKEATRQAERLLADKQSPLEWLPLNSAITREITSLKAEVSNKNNEIQSLRMTIAELTSTQEKEGKNKENGMESKTPNTLPSSKESPESLEAAQSKHSGPEVILRKKNGELY